MLTKYYTLLFDLDNCILNQTANLTIENNCLRVVADASKEKVIVVIY